MCEIFAFLFTDTYPSLLCSRLDDANRAFTEEKNRSTSYSQQLSDYESEINLMRRRVESLETDREKDKKQLSQLQDALNRARVVSRTNYNNGKQLYEQQQRYSYLSKESSIKLQI